MSWLRTDDAFSQHPKFEGWKVADKWAFLELMHYCARYRTGGYVPADFALLPRSVTVRLLELAQASGWLDERDGGLWIHDWDKYNPKDVTAAERAYRYRQRDAKRDDDRDANRDGERNDDRDESVTENVTEPLPRVRARAGSRPVPSLDPISLASEGLEKETINCKNCGQPMQPRQTCPKCGANPRAAGSNPRATAKNDRDQVHQQLLEHARQVADAWDDSGGSDVFDERLDQLEMEHHDRLRALERDDLWQKAFHQ